MLPDPAIYLLLTVFGGLIAVDGTGCGQFMLSRPFVAAALGGWIVGTPAEGAMIGLLLEAFHLTVLPVGAARYPESGPAAVAAGALFPLQGGGVAALTVIVFFLAWARVGGASVRILRQLNMRLVAVGGAALEPGSLARRHIAALFLDFVRGALLVAVGIAVLGLMLRASSAFWGAGEQVPWLAVEVVVAALLASCLRLFGGRGIAFSVGAAAGLLLLALGI